MNKLIKKIISSITVLLLIIPALGLTAERLESNDLGEVYKLALEKRKLFGADQVLVVFDIDNTLLASNNDLGSDSWYEWQSELIKSGEFEHAVSKDIPGLIAAQYMLYTLGNMRETQAMASDVVFDLQSRGITTIALTARGSKARNVTLRELTKNEIYFNPKALDSNGGYPGSYVPFDINDAENYGLTIQELNDWGITSTRDVSYSHGIFMASGQHKGAMLRTLLAKTKRAFKSIIFVDDKSKNTEKMIEGFESTTIDMTAVRYSKEDSLTQRFLNGPKQEVIHQWALLISVLSDIFQ